MYSSFALLIFLPLTAATPASARSIDTQVDIPLQVDPVASPQPSNSEIPTLSCGQERGFSDDKGNYWQLRFQCFPTFGVVNWHFRFSPALRAIAASWATEDGLRWWRNGAEQPKGSPHFVPLDYTVHGTMNAAYVGDTLDYQDYITFLHNMGSGGTAALTFAGSIRLVY